MRTARLIAPEMTLETELPPAPKPASRSWKVAALRTSSLFDTAPRFDGQTFDPVLDADRLRRQLGRVFNVMRDGRWRTLRELAAAVEWRRRPSRPACGISETKTRARDVQRRRRGCGGLFEYRLLTGGRL